MGENTLHVSSLCKCLHLISFNNTDSIIQKMEIVSARTAVLSWRPRSTAKATISQG